MAIEKIKECDMTTIVETAEQKLKATHKERTDLIAQIAQNTGIGLSAEDLENYARKMRRIEQDLAVGQTQLRLSKEIMGLLKKL
jgi:flagellar biosynthesis chaperone FliJ